MDNREKNIEMLQEIRTAIKMVLVGGQSYKIGSRSLTRADLSQLRAMEKELAASLQNDDPNLLGNTSVSFFDRR